MEVRYERHHSHQQWTSEYRIVREAVSNPREYQRQLDGKGSTPASKRTSFKSRKWQSSPDLELSWKRKRTFGCCGAMPAEFRQMYTEGERAALTVIVNAVKVRGECDLPTDCIAAIAGVCRTTVQNAVRSAKRNNHLLVYYRPRPGKKNLPNIIRIINKEWLAWINRGPPPLRAAIGFNLLHPTVSQK
ncbi:hypothetical protein [Sinorhizobium fredii]|uniref:hypothetical protein n=1 Tax=Rhizobium fredii TaxID=380 RepID=UPI000AECEEC4|nr:hypothetical protein [Sinorhizobium fredii]WOS65378.1 hypothetical protein SFGR64A_28190 [Sinorhizobium fredii GR64]